MNRWEIWSIHIESWLIFNLGLSLQMGFLLDLGSKPFFAMWPLQLIHECYCEFVNWSNMKSSLLDASRWKAWNEAKTLTMRQFSFMQRSLLGLQNRSLTTCTCFHLRKAVSFAANWIGLMSKILDYFIVPTELPRKGKKRRKDKKKGYCSNSQCRGIYYV